MAHHHTVALYLPVTYVRVYMHSSAKAWTRNICFKLNYCLDQQKHNTIYSYIVSKYALDEWGAPQNAHISCIVVRWIALAIVNGVILESILHSSWLHYILLVVGWLDIVRMGSRVHAGNSSSNVCNFGVYNMLTVVAFGHHASDLYLRWILYYISKKNIYVSQFNFIFSLSVLNIILKITQQFHSGTFVAHFTCHPMCSM